MIQTTMFPIRPETAHDLLTATTESGSVLIHYSVVERHSGSLWSAGAIDYRPAGDVESELAELEREMMEHWEITDAALVRRVGKLAPGDIISLVAVSASASDEAFDACRYGLARMRKMRSIDILEIPERQKGIDIL